MAAKVLKGDEILASLQAQIEELKLRVAKLEVYGWKIPSKPDRIPCPGCDGHECDDGCQYPRGQIR